MRPLPDTGIFKIIVNGELKTYHDWREIPKVIDEVVCFLPDFIPGPHQPGEHEANAEWYVRFKEVLRRQTHK